ncbi:hypothetical protein BKA80DRAFT_282817 [Phyllosticta citrichinensis]
MHPSGRRLFRSLSVLVGACRLLAIYFFLPPASLSFLVLLLRHAVLSISAVGDGGGVALRVGLNVFEPSAKSGGWLGGAGVRFHGWFAVAVIVIFPLRHTTAVRSGLPSAPTSCLFSH